MPKVRLRPIPPRPSFPLLSRWRVAVLALCLALGGGAGWAAPNAKASRFYEDALVRYEKKDLKGAIIQLKNALQIERDMLPVQLLLGRVLLADGQPGQAEVAFTEALRLGVDRAEVVVPLAQSLIDQGKQVQLTAESRFATAGLPAGVQMQLLLLKASGAADIGQARDALRLVEQARALDPASPASWVAEVPVRLRAGQFSEALVAADKALALSPQSPDARYQRSQIDHLRGDLKAALDGYGKALQLDGSHLEARVARAGLRIDLGQLAEARADAGEVRRIAPQDPRGAYLQALLAERAGERAQVLEALKEVTSLIDPVPLEYVRYRPQVLMLNGLAHYGLGEREKAKPYLETYQKLDPGGGVSKLLAQILLVEGNIAPAIDSLEKYLRAHPGDAQAQALLASAHMAQGRNTRATAVAQEGLKRNDAPELRTALGLSLLRSGQTEDALTELEAAFRKDPNQTRAAATLVGLYLQGKQTAKALALAESLVKRAPGQASFLNLLGQAQLAGGKTAAARSSFEQAGKADAALLGPQVQLARLDAAEGKLDAATSRLTSLLSKDERNTDLQFELATLMELRGQPDEARRWLEKAIDHAGPREYRAALALVDLHMRRGEIDKALEVAKNTSAKMPAELPPLLALARVQLAAGERDGARGTLGTATRLAAFEAPLQLEIALLQMMAGNTQGASYSLDKALSSQPDYLPAQAALVDVEIRQGRLSQAEELARRIVQKHPKLALGHSLLGDIAWAKGQVPAAAQAWARAHQVEPSTDTLLRLHRAVYRQESPKAAAALLEQWVKQRPADRIARNALAGLWARMGQFAAARSAYEALLKDSPKDPDLLNNLANVLLQIKPADAVAVAERALAASPGNPKVIDTLGWTLFQVGQNDRALQLLRDARLRSPGEPVIRYHLAAVLAKSGRTGEAREELQAALARAPRFEGFEQAQALLKSLP